MWRQSMGSLKLMAVVDSLPAAFALAIPRNSGELSFFNLLKRRKHEVSHDEEGVDSCDESLQGGIWDSLLIGIGFMRLRTELE
jgi:hypothetical protein